MKTESPFHEININVNNVKDILEVVLKSYADNPVFCFKRENEVSRKYKEEFYLDVKQIGNVFHNMFEKGSHIALLGKTSYEWLACYFGIMNSENVVIPLDRELPNDELREVVEFSDAVCILYDDSCLEKIRFLEKCLKQSVKYISIQPIEGQKCVWDIVDAIKNTGVWEGEPKASDVAEIVFTSGTTGKSKGCMITHGNLACNAMNCSRLIQLTNKDRALSILPVSHTFEISAGILTPLCCGVTICINESLKYLVPNMLNYRPTVMTVVPLIVETFYKNIWREIKKYKKLKRTKLIMNLTWLLYKCHIDIRRRVFSPIIDRFGGELRVLVVGGAYMEPRIIKDFAKLGITIIQGYGITECAPVVSSNTDKLIKYNSVGKVVNNTRVKIVDGEILVKGPIVMKGYYKNKQATEEAFDEGWFKTGDLGYLDSDDYLYITGRKKNLIILNNGENISPEYLERKILLLSYVKEVVVSERDGKIQAEVLLDTESEEANERIAEDIVKLNKKMPDYMKIANIFIRKEEFEKTSTSKIKRNVKG